ncbi:MAG: phosphotransferase [Akkermansiaceae bacterium]
MKPYKRYIEDGESASGSVNVVTRDGDSVLRPMGHWSTSVHELLGFLEDSGFDYSPRFLEIDEEAKRERLSYIQGEVALRPWPRVLCSLGGLEQLAEMLRRYHEVARKFQPKINQWHLLDRELPADSIIRHGDLGPWNIVWDGERLVGLIDWDFAELGTAIEDVAQAAWQCIPLKPSSRTLQTGVFPEDQQQRLEFFCKAYGCSVEEVIGQVKVIQNLELDRMNTHGKAGVEPWVSFLNRGDVEFVSEDAAWLNKDFEIDLQKESPNGIMEKVTLSGYILVPERDLELVRQELPAHIKLTMTEAGCLIFKVEEHQTERGRFDVYEEFESKQAFEHHQYRVRQSDWFVVTMRAERFYTVLGLAN